MKTPKKPAAKPRAPKTPPLSLSIDYPQEGERLLPGHYSIRVGAPGATQAELCVDFKEWRPCREAVGYFWFDWNPEPAGARALEARARRGKGRWVKTPVRAIMVLPGSGV